MSDLISVGQARAKVLERVWSLPLEQVALDSALGRISAESVVSTAAVPPFDSAAMDGFAVPSGKAGELRIVGEARAGHTTATELATGEAVRISTGAAVPPNAHAVVPSEDVEQHPGSVAVPSVESGANIRRRGEAIPIGEAVIGPGADLGPAALGVLASVGRDRVNCSQRPRVAIIATGDELTDPGGKLAPGHIWSSNPSALAGQVRRAGGEIERALTVADDPAATRTEIAAALGAADVVCISGGVSIGPHDHVRSALTDLGVERVFWGVALRPGKPTLFGTAESDGSRALVFGLPGNPVSAMATFQLFVRPALRALQGTDPAASRMQAVLAQPVTRMAQRDQAVRCRLRPGKDAWHATPTGPQGSHVLTSMLKADALAIVEAGSGEVAANERVVVELLD